MVETDRGRARFLQVLERELPRPATSLTLALDRLQRDGALRPPAVAELRRDAERMQFLARDFVALGRLQSEPLSLGREPVDLRSLITELVAQRPDRSRIFVNIQEGQSFKVSADAARVAQAITAMLDEAHGGTFALLRRPVSRGLRASITLPRLSIRARGAEPR